MADSTVEVALSPFTPLSKFSFLLAFLSDNLESVHWAVEAVLLLFILFLFFQKSYKPKERKLSAREMQELIDDFDPEPLVPELTPQQSHELQSAVTLEAGSIFPLARVRGKEVLNLATSSFLGYLAVPQFQDAAVTALRKYGTGSCGPRGFLGTADVHLDLERKLREFLGTEDGIIYSSQYATVMSFMCCVAGRHDILVVDRGARHAIKLGADLSRARVEWFDHNDAADLQRVWERLQPDRESKKIPFSTRIWLVVEGISENFGDVCPLPAILEMKEKYKFRIMLEESNSIGVLGRSGKGVTEHFSVPISSVECIVGSLTAALSSEGGFCVGQAELVDFQRLNGSGYVFSASLPPFLAVAALTSISMIEQDGPEQLLKLRAIISKFRSHLRPLEDSVNIVGHPESPIIHFRLRQSGEDTLETDRILQKVCDICIDSGILVSRAKYVTEWQGQPTPSVRVNLHAALSDSDISAAASALIAGFGSVKMGV